jgi:chromosome segregation ATPase
MTNETPNQETELKFFGLSLSNFKNLSHKVIDIGGKSIMIVGPNGSGKSSLIQALCSPLDTKIVPSKPIKKGEERSTIEVVLQGIHGGHPAKYTLDLYFSPGNEKGRLVVKNEKDEVIKSPATFVKGLIGNVSFDVLFWLRETNEKRLKMLKQLTGCEIEIDKINKNITEKKATKKSRKERAEELEAVLKNHGYTQEQIELYTKPIPVEPIQMELTNISTAITEYTDVENKMTQFKNSINSYESKIADRRTEIERLQALIKAEEVAIEVAFAEITKNKNNLIKGDAWLEKKGVKPSSEEISKRLSDATLHNQHHVKVSSLADSKREEMKFKRELIEIDVEVEKLEKQRGDLIGKSQLPIKRMSFTEDQILIDGLPLEEGQQNTADLFDIGVDVAIALNPGLKVIFLHEASLFDPKNLEVIIKKIEDRGFQVVAEIVEAGELDIKFTEREVK